MGGLTVKKILNLYKNIDSMNRLSSRSSLYPPIISIETSAICNLACNKCPVGRERKVPFESRFMDMELYRKIIAEIKHHIIIVNLSYLGEPLVNPDFFEYVRIAKENKLTVSFYSNGVALNSEIIANIVKHDVDHINFSIDCLPEQYLFYSEMKNINPDYAKSHLENIIKNIELLCAEINKSKKNTMVYAIRMESQEGTPEAEFNEFWKKRGVIPLSGGVMDWGGAVDRIKVTRKRSKLSGCSHPYSLGIQSDGIVSLCSIDFNTSVKIGDAGKQSIKEIYNCETIRDIRKRLAYNDVLGLPCSKCGFEDYLITKQNPFFSVIRHLARIYLGQLFKHKSMR